MSVPAALARLREGTEVLRTGGGVRLTASECNVLLDHIEALRARPTITGSSHRADDPGQVWVRMSEADYEALRG